MIYPLSFKMQNQQAVGSLARLLSNHGNTAL